MKANEIREMFLRYFEERGHKRVPSASLVPWNDPTLLFINAGMNQFKDVFLGLEKRDYTRAVSSQKCVRAGGKHNDLENVGFTNRHHTFFEMLGNFSFGDYFKKEAIEYAWELVTSPDWYGIDKDKLYVTIFEGDENTPRDDEAYNHWLAQGVPKERILECGAKDNFWQMGETGPCGPCSEIHYDMGVEASDEGHKDCQFPCECGRYTEIWNLVFMQFDRNAKGKLTPLPKPSIDTGAGLERLAAVLQGKISNYDTDLFTPLIKRAEELTGSKFGKDAQTDASLRIIADHARAATCLISDGVFPANEGRGYVLRKIMRRAIRHGRLLGVKEPFLHEMVHSVSDDMKDAYPEIAESAIHVVRVVRSEEIRFAHTMSIAVDKFNNAWVMLPDSGKTGPRDSAVAIFGLTRKHYPIANQDGEYELIETGKPTSRTIRYKKGFVGTLLPDTAFELYDTYGLAFDFIQQLAHDHKVWVDEQAFLVAMEQQRERARASWKGKPKEAPSMSYQLLPPTPFEGYTQTSSTNCAIQVLIHNGKSVSELKAGKEGEAVLDHTPFYAESGGQVGDIGWFYDRGQNVVLAKVGGCTSPIQGVTTHHIKAQQTLVLGDKVDAVVNAQVREETMRNHTATHLLHAALRENLGAHVKQAGSLVDPAHLRFDFSHFSDVADEELQDIEDRINREILGNMAVEVHEDVPIDTAINEFKAMALFGEKYGDKVRVIKIGDFSVELCGGTHVARTGEIGLVKIVSESSVAAGVRRVEAISGAASLRQFQQRQAQAEQLSRLLQVGDGNLLEAAEKLVQQSRQAGKQLDAAKTRMALQGADELAGQAQKIKGVAVVAAVLQDVERGALRSLVDTLRQKLGSGVVVLGTVADGKAVLIVGVTKDLTEKLHAGKIIKELAAQVGGKGGGRPDLAEAGGKDPDKLPQAIAQAAEIIEKML